MSYFDEAVSTTIKPDPCLKAAGPTLTIGELRQALLLQPEWRHLTMSFAGREFGFDSMISIKKIFRVSANGGDTWYFAGSSSWTHYERGMATEIKFRNTTYHAYGSGQWVKKEIIETVLNSAQPTDEIYMAFPRTNVFSPTGLHFIVPILDAGPEVFVSMNNKEEERIYRVNKTTLALHGGL